MEEWGALYKIGRLAALALVLFGIAIWLYRPSQKDRFEEPARRMLEDDEDDDEVAEWPRPGAEARDGIGEDDHPIPGWFNLGFYGFLVVGLGYIFFYGAMAPYSQARVHAVAVAAAEEKAAALRASMPTANPYRGNPGAEAEGAEVYATICVACHRPDGSGLVGPSLVDPYWKYGSDDASLFASVAEGRPLGMPPWGPQLGSEKIWKVLAYIETLPKSDTAGVGSPEFDAAKAGGS